MDSEEEYVTLRLDYGQILSACYEWAARRGFKPKDGFSMKILEIPSQYEGQEYALEFLSENPTGEWCWDKDNNVYPYSNRSDLPWVDEYVPTNR